MCRLDCDRVRSAIVGLPPCCKLCHLREQAHLQTFVMVLNGHDLRVCCKVLSEVLSRWPGTVTVREVAGFDETDASSEVAQTA